MDWRLPQPAGRGQSSGLTVRSASPGWPSARPDAAYTVQRLATASADQGNDRMASSASAMPGRVLAFKRRPSKAYRALHPVFAVLMAVLPCLRLIG